MPQLQVSAGTQVGLASHDDALRSPRATAAELRRHAWDIAQAGLQAVQPDVGFHRQIRRQGNILRVGRREYDLGKYRRVFVLGAGKATALIAQNLERTLAGNLAGGVIVVRPEDVGQDLSRVKVLTASHPLPTSDSVQAAHALLDLASTLTTDDLAIACFTGGSSSLVSAPPPGISEAAKREVHGLLLASGARIQQINAVRKNLSVIKGGALARVGSAATWINITVSDVVGDDLQYITDPTVPNTDSPADAVAVLRELGLWNRVHEDVRRWLLRDIPTPSLAGVDIHSVILASGSDALAAMEEAVLRRGFSPVSLGSSIEGDARKVGMELARRAAGITEPQPPAQGTVLFAAGGEVTVSGKGLGDGGGPNQELALSFAEALPPGASVAGLFMDSDGFDGPTRHAGGLVDGGTAGRLRACGIDVGNSLSAHESTCALAASGDLISSGTTGTNISDVAVIVAGAPARPHSFPPEGKVLLLGWKAPVVRELLAQNINVVCVVEPGRTPEQASGLLEVIHAGDPADASDVLSALYRHGHTADGISHVLSAKEFPLIAASILARALNARGMELTTAVALRDKSVQKDLVRQAGIETASSVVLNTRDDLASSRLEPPFVVKPLAGGGSHNTFVVRHLEEDKAMIAEAFKESAPVLAESYVEGSELHADGVVRDGVVRVLTVSKYLVNLVNVHHGAPVGSVLLPENSHGDLYDQARQMVTAVLHALGHLDGVFHLEAFSTAKGLVFSECAGRVAGGKIDSVVAAATGVDLHKEWVNAALGRPMTEITPRSPESSYGQLRLVAGVLESGEPTGRQGGHETCSIPSEAEVLAQASVLEASLAYPGPAKAIDATAASNLGHGWVMATGQDPRLLAKRLNEIADWFMESSEGTRQPNQGTESYARI